MVAQALASRLSADYEVAAIVGTAAEVTSALSTWSPDCLLLDLLLHGENGIALLPAIRRLRPQMHVLVVTMFNDWALVRLALEAGADGYIPKDSSIEELTSAIAEVIAGRRYVSPRIPRSAHKVSIGAHYPLYHRLTPRQQEVAELIGEGKSAGDIAHLLGLAPSTVTFHKQNVMRVLGLASESELLRFAMLFRRSCSADGPRTAASTLGDH